MQYVVVQTPSIALTGLGDGLFAATPDLDNTPIGSRAVGADIQISITTGGTVSATGTIGLYILRSVDGVIFDDANDNAELLGVFKCNVASTNFVFSVDTMQLGIIGPFQKLAVKNSTGGTLAGGSLRFVGKKFQFLPG
jgi:hypothetical protein